MTSPGLRHNPTHSLVRQRGGRGVYERPSGGLLVIKCVVKGHGESFHKDGSLVILLTPNRALGWVYEEPRITDRGDLRVQLNLRFYQDVCSIIFLTYYNPALCLNSRHRILVSRPIKTHSGSAPGPTITFHRAAVPNR